jgi:hypothetical protein
VWFKKLTVIDNLFFSNLTAFKKLLVLKTGWLKGSVGGGHGMAIFAIG